MWKFRVLPRKRSREAPWEAPLMPIKLCMPRNEGRSHDFIEQAVILLMWRGTVAPNLREEFKPQKLHSRSGQQLDKRGLVLVAKFAQSFSSSTLVSSEAY